MLGQSEERMWTYMSWVGEYLLADTLDRPISWWIRLLAYYTMLTACSTWEEDSDQ
jgi:hypothetical protein